MKDRFKVTLIVPHMGRRDPADLGEYVRSWHMENLATAVLAGLTPRDVEIAFFDERLEHIDFDDRTDLVAVTVETYTAKRAYEIAAQYRRRGVPVVMGGYHVMLVPDEVLKYAESILVGFAEDVWPRIIEDARRGQLQRRYARDPSLPMRFGTPDRSISKGRRYVNVALVETGRGCPLHCNFCCVSAATGARYHPRPVEEVVQEVRSIVESNRRRLIFFVDDNIIGDVAHAKRLFRELAPLKARWVSQGSVNIARDDELLDLMAKGGCAGLLVGFESLNENTLLQMDKQVNVPIVRDLKAAVDKLHRHGICLYGAFVFGYEETLDDFQRCVQTAMDIKLSMAAFAPLIPFPGTKIHAQLLRSKQMANPRWYLDPGYRFGDVPYSPSRMGAAELRQACLEARRRFYSWPSIVRRASNVRGNLTFPYKAAAFLYMNWLLRKEIDEKDGRPLGNEPLYPSPE